MNDDGNLCPLCARIRSIKSMMATIEAMDEWGEYLDDDLTEAFNALDDALCVHKHYRGDGCAEELGDYLYSWDQAEQAGSVSFPYGTRETVVRSGNKKRPDVRTITQLRELVADAKQAKQAGKE